MTRHRTYTDAEDQPLSDGDVGFVGVDERGDPSELKPGFVSRARNKRFRNGVAEDRPGIAVCAWMKGDGTTPFSSIQGGGEFLDPDGLEWFLIAAEGKVWRTRPNNAAVEIPLPAGVVLSGHVEFVQLFNKIILARGFDDRPLELVDFATGFREITQATSGAGRGTGTEVIPNFRFGEFIQNRLVIAGDNDIGYVSDVENYTRYKIPTAFRINQGGTDQLIRFFKFGTDTVIAFKGQSIYPITNVVPDQLGDWSNAVLGEDTKSHGLVAPRSIVNVGRDLIYLSTKGVSSMQLTFEGKVQGVDIPLSDKIEKTIRRINWTYAANAVAAYWDNKYFLALPLDDAEFFGIEVIPAGSIYPSGGNAIISGLTVGQLYYYTKGPNETLMQNGPPSNIHSESCYFTAVDTTINLAGPADGSNPNVTCSIKPVSRGVNNAVLVYDFLNREWAGTDESKVINVHRWMQLTYCGVRRLFALGGDGVIRLYEDGFEDQTVQAVAVPYADLIVNFDVQTPASIQVNGGTLVQAAFQSDNASGNWGIVNSRSNIWRDGSGLGGFDQTASSPWSAPDTLPERISDGVRFTSTNGVLPLVTITGQGIGGETEGFVNLSTWGFIDPHSGNEIACLPIESELVTRGYICGDVVRKHFDQFEMLVATWSPKYSITAIVDGVNEVRVIRSGITKNRLRYYSFGTPDWDPTNVNRDHGNKGREDYSIVPDTIGVNLDDPGLNPDEIQDSTEARRISLRGKYVQLKVTNADGVLNLKSLTVQARDAQRRLGVKA